MLPELCPCPRWKYMYLYTGRYETSFLSLNVMAFGLHWGVVINSSSCFWWRRGEILMCLYLKYFSPPWTRVPPLSACRCRLAGASTVTSLVCVQLLRNTSITASYHATDWWVPYQFKSIFQCACNIIDIESRFVKRFWIPTWTHCKWYHERLRKTSMTQNMTRIALFWWLLPYCVRCSLLNHITTADTETGRLWLDSLY